MKAEKKASPRRSRVAKWEWRKNYRIWDANRKIFIYPENWVEPELRPPPECPVLLREVVAAVRAQSGIQESAGRARPGRAKGVHVLLSSKNRADTLATAQVLASELRLDLYRIDLSGVVNKFIGETEKNLSRIFDAAENRNVLIFFDEADALFGKRSEVKDSHDRYANIETNYLLQRIEAFEGFAILATASRRDLDDPFLRRFHFIVPVAPPRKGR